MSEASFHRLANASLLAALGVVAIHLPLPYEAGSAWHYLHRLVSLGLGKAAVPFFFLVSGYLLALHAGEPGWWKSALRKRVRTLLVPYLIWSVAFALVLFAASAIKELPALPDRAFVTEWLTAKKGLVFGLDVTDVPLLVPLWYVRTLAILAIASPLILGILGRCGKSALYFLFAVSLLFSFAVEYRPEIIFDPVIKAFRQTLHPESVFYFSLGLWLQTTSRRSDRIGLRRSPLVLSVSASLAVALLVLRVILIFSDRPYLVPYAVVVPFVLIAFWESVPDTPWPAGLTSLSFPIYILHYFVLHAADVLLAGRGDNVLRIVVVYLLAVLLSAACALALRRFAPRFAAVAFGGR